jgi:NADPH2:quinone reductase
MMAAHLQSSFKLGYLKPLLGRIYSLEEAAQAHTDIIHGTGAHGRITIKIRE